MTAEQLDESTAAQYDADYVAHMRQVLPPAIAEATRAAEAWEEYGATVRALPKTRPASGLWSVGEDGEKYRVDLLPDVLHARFAESRTSVTVLGALADAAVAAAWRVVADLKEDLRRLEERAS